ncbi:hypothetical protein WJX72_006353 [[Myrmecia] bisecta]|uniref:Uncharacterized protein n=1 Tax=[Myrmecia] bisecta TaxID=41462 RepID=A0AAW1P918_9CHLO
MARRKAGHGYSRFQQADQENSVTFANNTVNQDTPESKSAMKAPLLMRSFSAPQRLSLRQATPNLARTSTDLATVLNDPEVKHLQDMCDQKQAELGALRERVERLEAMRGVMSQLEYLDAQTSQLKVLVQQKDEEIKALAQRKMRRQMQVLPALTSGVGDYEKKVASEANRWARKALKVLSLKPASPLTPKWTSSSEAESSSPFFYSPLPYMPVNPAAVQKDRFVVVAVDVRSKLTFRVNKQGMWLGKVCQRGDDSYKLHYYMQPEGKQASLHFAPVVDQHGYPMVGSHSLEAHNILAVFDDLACPCRGGSGDLPFEVVDEIVRRLQGRSQVESSSASDADMWA